MPFGKKGGLSKKRDQIDNVIVKLEKHKALWYTSSNCGWCKKLEKELESIDHRFKRFITTNTNNMPAEIKGFPTLHIPATDEIDAQFFSGYMPKVEILKIVSKLQ